MNPDFVPEEAASVTATLTSVLRKKRRPIFDDKSPWGDAPYRTTIYLKDGDVYEFYEAQGRPHLHPQLLNFAHWLSAQRKCAELILVAPADAPTTADLFAKLRKCGVGLLLRNGDQSLEQVLAARNPAFVVTPDPSLPLRDLRSKVNASIQKFNDGQRKDGFRDLCEYAEHETERVLVSASASGWISLTKPMIEAKDWSDKINTLASKTIMNAGRAPLIDAKLKDDLHSFRGARNLADHPARTRVEKVRLFRQLCERMLMGTRLVSELASIRARIR